MNRIESVQFTSYMLFECGNISIITSYIFISQNRLVDMLPMEADIVASKEALYEIEQPVIGQYIGNAYQPL